ncbi:hypothetical protein [Yinghuangia sp. YIM S09857]|uniref:hypothetical protein n=1 Tax=Yinghuangia sp. YIM S09857 TaxID=3436929 RepID=UPI003F5399DB
MTHVDLRAASDFMATHARILDRLRFRVLVGDAVDAGQLLAAVDAYRNPDGGYGWGLECDLRSPESQVGAALHAFEVFEDAAAPTPHQGAALCDWLASITLPDGGLPFALPITDPAGSAPWWGMSDPSASSLQLTSVVAAAAHRAAAYDPAIRTHTWLNRATRYCITAAIRTAAEGRTPHALELAYAVRLLDMEAVRAAHPDAAEALDVLAAHVPADGMVHVDGGTENEYMRPLDFAPLPGTPARRLLASADISGELERLERGQHDDGGWTVEYARISPAGAMEWRGHATVRALGLLRANGVL